MESEPSKHTDYFWVLKPNNDNYYNVTVISKNGDTSFTTLAIGEWGTRPVIFLSSDVKIIDGDGTASNPYKLKNK